MKTVYFRFYEELNDFLPEVYRKKRFERKFIDRTSVKDMIESLGVPHTEIDLILVNSESVAFDYIVEDGDDISVYPVFESLDISNIQHLRSKPLRKPKFVLDVHLGKLAKYMRMIGLDTLYENDYSDEKIVEISLKEKRTILTKDIGILKRKNVNHGYYVRNTESNKQVKEIVSRFQLQSQIRELIRCLECNALLKSVKKEIIINELPPKVRKYYDEFFQCPKCKNIYWKGSHYERMVERINGIRNEEV